MLSLILAESSLELVPKKLQTHNSILSHAKKLGKHPSQILLDNSWHFAAMKGIDNENKRGRPDLVHFSILEACTIPLYTKNKLDVFIHTIDDNVIYLKDNVHIPKSYHRFAGLIEKLFSEKNISIKENQLLEIKEKTLSQLIDEINPSKVIGFSTEGTPSSYETIASKLDKTSCIVVGGFQKGHFTSSTKNKIDELFSIDSQTQESHVVVSRILYEYEKTVFM